MCSVGGRTAGCASPGFYLFSTAVPVMAVTDQPSRPSCWLASSMSASESVAWKRAKHPGAACPAGDGTQRIRGRGSHRIPASVRAADRRPAPRRPPARVAWNVDEPTQDDDYLSGRRFFGALGLQGVIVINGRERGIRILIARGICKAADCSLPRVP